ncbi:MAG: TauD/TfdA dioxygenase family protein [Alphaproteobacteria bacterium]
MATMAARQKRQKAQVVVEKVGAALGAEISNVDLTRPVAKADMNAIQKAFVKHGLLIFRHQDLTQDEYIAFGRQFGELTVHPFATSLPDHPELIVLDNDGDNPPLSTDQWHSDEMFREEPPAATIIRSTITPPVGGDTLLASMTAAYDGLNPALQDFYANLEAVNDFKVFRALYQDTYEGRKKLVEMEELFPNMAHPVVRVHPVSKKRLIYVSPQTTKYIKGVRDFESEQILQMLYQLPEVPEYQYRVRWEPNMIIIWDNRSTQHYAPRDYLPHRRRMERLTVKGDKPIGTKKKLKSTVVEMNIRGTDKAEKTGSHRKNLARPATTMTKKK